MSLPSFAPEFLEGFSAEEVAAAQARYAEAVQVVVDSLEAPVGLTPKKEVWRLNKTRLYRYKPTRPPEERQPIPLLLVYALINRSFPLTIMTPYKRS